MNEATHVPAGILHESCKEDPGGFLCGIPQNFGLCGVSRWCWAWALQRGEQARAARREELPLIIQSSSSLLLKTNGKWMDLGNESPVGYLGLKQNLSS